MMLVPIEKRHFGGYGIILWITVWIVFPSHATDETITKFSCTDTRDGYWLHLGEGPVVELAALVATGVVTEVDPQSEATLSTDLMVSAAAGAGFDVTVATTVDVSGCIGPHIETDSVSTSEAPSGTRFKKVRKAEALGTATAESLAAPEKKMRAEGVLLVESEAETNSSAGLESGETKSHARRSDEARTRKNLKDSLRQRAKTSRISSSKNMAETDSAQEAEGTEGPGKCENSTEHPHGLD